MNVLFPAPVMPITRTTPRPAMARSTALLMDLAVRHQKEAVRTKILSRGKAVLSVPVALSRCKDSRVSILVKEPTAK